MYSTHILFLVTDCSVRNEQDKGEKKQIFKKCILRTYTVTTSMTSGSLWVLTETSSYFPRGCVYMHLEVPNLMRISLMHIKAI